MVSWKNVCCTAVGALVLANGLAQPLLQTGLATDLRTALRLAVAEHPQMRARQADVDAARADMDSARYQYWPTPSVSTQHPDKPLLLGTDRSVTMLNLRQPLWTGGRLQSGLALSQAKQQTAQAVQEETRRDIALEVVQAWVDACTAAARIQVYEESLVAQRQFLTQIQRRVEFGLSVQSDISLASSRLEAMLADLSASQAALEAAQERLHTQLGHRVNSPELPAAPWPPIAEHEVLHLSQQVDPTLLRMRAEELELLAQIDSSKSAFWPELSTSVTQRQGDITGRTMQVSIGFESKWGGGLSNVSALQAATQRLQAKKEDIAHRTRKLAEQIRADQMQLKATRTRVQAFKQALEAAKDVTQSWGRQFAAGKKTWQDVMNAVREDTQAHIQWVDAVGTAAAIDWRLALVTHGVSAVLQME